MMRITWKTMGDTAVCVLCEPLEGHTWTFQVGVDPFPNLYLFDLDGEPVWHVEADKSLTHGDATTCRCKLIITWDFTEMEDGLRQLRQALESTSRVLGKITEGIR